MGTYSQPHPMYHVVDTPCWPARWKVKPRWPYKDDNMPGNYFVKRKDAEKEAEKRNKLWDKYEGNP